MSWMPPKPNIKTPAQCDPNTMAHYRDAQNQAMEYYVKEIAPLFENAVEVECSRTLGNHPGAWYASENGHAPKTHKALLIKIEPIKKESAEDLLREIVAAYEKPYCNLDGSFTHGHKYFAEAFEKARAWLKEHGK